MRRLTALVGMAALGLAVEAGAQGIVKCTPVPQVVHDVLGEHAVESCRVDHDDVIEARASDRADDAFRVAVLPR